jgi:hypothetical protein
LAPQRQLHSDAPDAHAVRFQREDTLLDFLADRPWATEPHTRLPPLRQGSSRAFPDEATLQLSEDREDARDRLSGGRGEVGAGVERQERPSLALCSLHDRREVEERPR